MVRTTCLVFAIAAVSGVSSPTQAQRAQPSGPAPTHANIAYAPAEPAGSNGHLLDLYLPEGATGPTPTVIWTSGSAWFADTGKTRAEIFAAELIGAGFAVVGVSIRSSRQVKFPGQLHDVKAAIRWLRSNASSYNLDPQRIAIMGASSGGWTAAMAAVTGDVPELEGGVGVTGVSSAVQAAVAFYPPTDFLQMDEWGLRPCQPNAAPGPGVAFCHDGASSPESSLIGCAIQSCPDQVQLANPARYVSEPRHPKDLPLRGRSQAKVRLAVGPCKDEQITAL